ncbi:Segregation and condensation protein B [Rhodopseudomonas palustris]|uniref:SMC-Scp complex subunit ScpB n=1 Tax=Rhodopseudomonas palustris (strain ATCC BAA-98 / CGA009) TaxID=258594 RepID=Q6N5X0_RHOPA|nr:SMC-Scp complex subunit ScpB [Rhodopseudomonas palustris]OPF89927.1 SMC-Scp complex subunit ScpB [Rhodopseudomonas palustris]QQM04380.1 Segregation and condensation protein B [Rhodopseudomonas palustris]RJF65976.1 SMC-Scp complex subunit ScpB [Rhodopseudomonas palustris]WAB75768.1 SMC-Scp complex subunit ScpB [Rhodopseudomonas palustris]WCL93017.1 SMC-Scp complex subunit ScpB [Rhodopseudomonas palustris CGA009]
MASLAEKRIVEFEQPVEHLADDSAEQQPQSRPEELRLLEALLFASPEPLDQAALAKRMPEGVDVKVALKQLQEDYASRGVNLVRIANKWTFRTASDLAWLMTRESTETRKLSRAAIEMLAIIAYHQPITRVEIEEIRGVATSKGTLDVLLETGWVKPRGRRKTPGRPLTFGTTEAFLSQFSLESLTDLPGLEELKGTGLLDTRLPTGFSVPTPSDDPALREDEDPLEPGDLDLSLAPQPELDLEGDAAAADEAGVSATAEATGAAETGEAELGVAEAAAHDGAAPEVGFAETSEDDAEEAETGFAETSDDEAEAETGFAETEDADEAGEIEDAVEVGEVGDRELEAEEADADDFDIEDDVSIEIETVEVELVASDDQDEDVVAEAHEVASDDVEAGNDETGHTDTPELDTAEPEGSEEDAEHDAHGEDDQHQ